MYNKIMVLFPLGQIVAAEFSWRNAALEQIFTNSKLCQGKVIFSKYSKTHCFEFSIKRWHVQRVTTQLRRRFCSIEKESAP